MTASNPLLDHYQAEFQRLASEQPGSAQQQAAMARFIAQGFPPAHDEHWKYSNTRPLQKQSYTPAAAVELTAETVAALMPQLDTHLLVFINGRLNQALSATTELPTGLKLNSLASTRASDNSDTDSVGDVINGHGHALTDMNAAFAADGVDLSIEANTIIEKPIYLLFVGHPSAAGQMVQLRNLIQLGSGSSATVVEHYVSANKEAYLSNCVTEISLAANAELKRVRLQDESNSSLQFGATFAKQQRDSRLTLHSTDLGGRWQRYDTHVQLNEPGAEIHLDGLYVPTGRQHIDNHTAVEHIAPHCISREEYKGILDGGSRGVFNGRIVVHKDAQKTDSEQSSAALLLSGKSEIDAKPELEIYADDVKCKHGATVGQLDDKAVFYLQSRGLSETDARNLLTYSFADELIQRIGIEPLQKHIEKAVIAKLPQTAFISSPLEETL